MTDSPRLSERLAVIVMARLDNDKNALPVLPEAATRCLSLVKDPNVSARQLSAALERDPLLTAQLLRVANSASFAGGATHTLEQAVARVGLNKVKTLVISACAVGIFESRDSRIREASRMMWNHSVAVGILTRDLMALGGQGDPESGYLGGLLHDVGKPLMAAFLLEAEKQIKELRNKRWMESAEWLETVRSSHRRVAVALAEKWNLPIEVVESIRDCDEFDPSNRHCVANYVRFANAVVKMEGIYVGDVDREDTQALIMIGRSMLGVDDDVVKRLSTSLKDRLQKMSN